ncbi:porin family protein [Rhodoplanes sp. TEM]|uniref:Porin family protein n=1 Tax=Rhodoplanes tepidamans TaxID=200616 RepID=A0ABT5J422_RHOTP|nr:MULTISPECIES: outer membrane protein [Rhodoplanes]MDC7784099.1 porin family protein [Rhodoplanes tepidamans]MDC7983194.1 porin family protein [Rhodoplanes sp. TEM]MDQ0356804.1 outer membrane immunogenic protein [Rhodoplanes tepidamans]
MKKILLAAAATIMAIGTASAADLSARMPMKAPPPVMAPVFSWTGCYIGGFVGGAWNADSTVATDLNGAYAPTGAWGYKTDSSFIGGGTAGCNWQPIGSPFVLGLEGEIGYLSMSGSAYDPVSFVPGTVVSSTKVGDWYGMITGRLGYSWGRALVYAKGGVAFVNVENTIANPLFIASVSETQATWTVGGGVEWAFDMNWSVKAEYMYIGVDNTQTVGAFGQNWDTENSGIHTAKVGLNYRFGGYGAPVMARY